MKRLLFFIVTIGLFTSSIYYMINSEVYIGDVIGKIKVSEKYTLQNRNYECGEGTDCFGCPFCVTDKQTNLNIKKHILKPVTTTKNFFGY